MNAQTQDFFIAGAVGQLECKLDLPPDGEPRGIALIAHPILCMAARWITKSYKHWRAHSRLLAMSACA